MFVWLSVFFWLVHYNTQMFVFHQLNPKGSVIKHLQNISNNKQKNNIELANKFDCKVIAKTKSTSIKYSYLLLLNTCVCVSGTSFVS